MGPPPPLLVLSYGMLDDAVAGSCRIFCIPIWRMEIVFCVFAAAAANVCTVFVLDRPRRAVPWGATAFFLFYYWFLLYFYSPCYLHCYSQQSASAVAFPVPIYIHTYVSRIYTYIRTYINVYYIYMYAILGRNTTAGRLSAFVFVFVF